MSHQSTPSHEQRDDGTSMLQKRIKKQSCLYKISKLNHKALSLDELLTKVANLIPKSFQYPDIAQAAIMFDGETYATPRFTETQWCLKEETEIRTGRLLTVKVTYLEEPPCCGEGPFPAEEKRLLEMIISYLELKMDQVLSQQEIREKQELLDKAYQLARIGSWEFDMQKHDLHWSPVTKEVHGFGQDYDPDVESTIALFKEGPDREQFAKAAMDAIEHEKPFDVELKIISGQGDERWIRATGEPDYNEEGVCTRFYGISQNVTARRQAEEDLLLSERRFKSMVQDGSDLIAILDNEANYKYVSPTSESILGIPAEQFIGTNVFDYIHEDDKEHLMKLLNELPNDERINIPPYRFKDAEGDWRWIETTLTNMTEDPAVGGLVANSRDVTTQIKQQQKNEESLKEKETLLAEIHHRVKNNLAVVSGMMQLQATEEKDDGIKERLFDSIVRIKTMANIHEQLYQSNSFSKLEFSENIKSLVMSIKQTLQSKTDISIEFDCDSIQLNINQAIPCSLIVNEVVTNIFKHAFPDMDKGHVVISLSKDQATEHVCLVITDNGVGLPRSISSRESSSLGLSLIDVLTEQLEADYDYKANGEGTIFSIQFDKDEQKGIGNHFM
ncbi:MAG TPA: PAS domain S-box protein [Balneolaceae bacterium]|nr:PAS domain S-box protein [Balneolaceae bacterium]